VGKMTRGMAAFGVGTELAVEKMTRGMAAFGVGTELGRVWLAAVQTSCIVRSLISSGMVRLHPKHRYVRVLRAPAALSSSACDLTTEIPPPYARAGVLDDPAFASTVQPAIHL
jgi:hypothetical protein